MCLCGDHQAVCKNIGRHLLYIVWNNVSDAIRVVEPCSPHVTFSCIEGTDVWPGTGNINADPLFCAWGALDEVYVDGANNAPGDER